MEVFVFLAGIGTGILIAVLSGHLIQRRSSRRQMALARLGWDMHKAVFDVQDAVAHWNLFPTEYRRESEKRLVELRELKAERNRAVDAYYAALKGEL